LHDHRRRLQRRVVLRQRQLRGRVVLDHADVSGASFSGDAEFRDARVSNATAARLWLPGWTIEQGEENNGRRIPASTTEETDPPT
jgi:hypothetical protein